MKLDSAQLALVEGHLSQTTTLKRFSAAYDEFLVGELGRSLAETLPGHSSFAFHVESWGLVCDAPNGEKWRLAFLTPANDHLGNPERTFVAGAWLSRKADEALHRRARLRLVGMKNFAEGGGEWWESYHADRASASKSLCEMARLLLGPEQAQNAA